MGWLLSVFIAATVFGVGVTAIDLLGLIGDHQGDDDSSAGDHDGGHGGGDHLIDAHADIGHFDATGDDGGDFDAAGDDGGGDDGDASDGDLGHVDTGDHDVTHSEEGDDDASVAGHDRRHRRSPVLRVLSTLRNFVYFCLGFGPTGWFALGTGRGTGSALAWGAGVGVVVLAGARALRRVLRSELSSEIQETDLLMEKGTVTVTVNPNSLGRVRVSLGGAYVDRYARSNSAKALPPGTAIRVVEIGEDCLIVESEEE